MVFQVRLNHSSVQANTNAPPRPLSSIIRIMSASIAIASCSECAPWSRPLVPLWALPSEDGTPNSVTSSGMCGAKCSCSDIR